MKLSEEKSKQRLERLSNWKLDQDRISKTFTCTNFLSAIHLVNQIAERSETMDHHPDILISNYNQVTITLTTHSANGLTNNDFDLADEIEKLYQSHSKKE